MYIIFQKVDQLINDSGQTIPSEFKDIINKTSSWYRFPPYHRYAVYLDKVVILFNDEKYLRTDIENLRKQFCIGEYEGYSVSRVMEKHGWKTIGHTLIIQCGFNSLEHVDAILSV